MIPPDLEANEAKSAPMGWRGLSPDKRRRDASRERKRVSELARQRVFRASMVMAFITALVTILAYRLVYWQVIMRDELLVRANKPTLESSITSSRGTIRDRNGYLLATDTVVYKFWVSPNIISYPDETAQEVSEIIGKNVAELQEIFKQDEHNVLIDDSLSYSVGQKLVEMDNPAFVIEPILLRSYPNSKLASHLLGFVNAERRGLTGVEMYYDELLSGQKKLPVLDGKPAEEIKLGHRPFTPSRIGVDLVLTIDRSIQVMIEKELKFAMKEYKATGGTIIVMEPKTGEVLGMASYPSYDPNHYMDYLDQESIFQDPAISRQYEPGSVFKIITIAAALDAGLVSPNTRWTDPGHFEVGGQVIKNWDQKAYSKRTITEIMGYSLNTGTAWLSTQLGSQDFYAYVERFGFGELTGIELSNEISGLVRRPGDGSWHPSDLGTNSFGQGIAVTPMQMISAVASLLNNGELMQARIVKAIVSRSQIQEMPPSKLKDTVSPQVAQTMRQMMVDAVKIATTKALLEDEGWLIGGKTGTAQIPIAGGYDPDHTISSFIGFAPTDEPAFIVLVKLDRPQGIYQWGSRSAAPTFKRIAHYLLNYYNIPPDKYRMVHTSEMPTALPMNAPPNQVEMDVHATPAP